MKHTIHGSRLKAAAVFLFITLITPGIFAQNTAQDATALRQLLSGLSHEEKAAQVLMVSIAGSKAPDKKSIAAFNRERCSYSDITLRKRRKRPRLF